MVIFEKKELRVYTKNIVNNMLNRVIGGEIENE